MNAPFQKIEQLLRRLAGLSAGPVKKPSLGLKGPFGQLEMLEDRSVPATLYADLAGFYTITQDTSPAGFSKGDTVTWNGASKVTGLIVGTNAFSGVADAVTAAAAGDTINLAPSTYANGNVLVNVNNLTVNVPSGATGFSLGLSSKSITGLTVTGAGAVNLTGNQYNNTLVGNDGSNVLNAELDVADLLKASPSTPISLPVAVTGSARVTAINPGGRFISNAGDRYYVILLRNGNANSLTVSASVENGAALLTNFTLPGYTDTYLAVPTDNGWSKVKVVGSGINGFPVEATGPNDFTLLAGGDDKLTGGKGNDTLRGGAGIDTAVYSGNRSDYTISVSGNSATIVDNRSGSPDGTDTLIDMEKAQFADGTVRILPSTFGILAGSSTNLVFSSNSIFGVTGTTSVSIQINGRTSDGTLVASAGSGVSVSGSGTNALTLSGTQDALNAYLSTAGNIKYNAVTSVTRPLTFIPSDGLNVTGYSTLIGTVAPAISSANTTSVTYGTSLNFAVAATGSPTPTFSISSGSLPAGISLNSTTGALTGITAAGTYKFTISASNGAGSAATQAFTLVVNKAALTIKADDKAKTTGAVVPALTATYTGLVNGDTASAIAGVKLATTALFNSPAGTYPITVTGGTNANYTITLVNGTLKVGTAPFINSTNKTTFTYGTPGTFQVTSTGSATVTYAITKGALPGGLTLNSATGLISGTVLPGNIGVFNFTITASNGIPNDANQVFNLTVNKANLVIKANNNTKVYGTELALGSTGFTVTGLLGSDKVNTATLTSSGAKASTPVGTYTIVPSAPVGTNLANYSISYANGSLSVTKATLTIKAKDGSKVYGANYTINPGDFTTTGFANGDKLTGLKLASTGTVLTAAAGTYAITPSAATGGSLGNYNVVYANGTLTVNKAALVVTANSRQKTLGSTIFLAGTEFTATGLKNADRIDSVKLTSSATAADAKIGNYAVSADGASGTGVSNYEIKYVAGSIKVVAVGDYDKLLGKGTFTTDASGKISVDFLYDGGGYVGQMGFYSLAGMTDLKVGSEEFIKEAARRVLTNSGEGRLIISDITDAARTSVKLKTDNVYNQGKYKGIQNFQMDGDSQFGVILIPNGTFTEVLAKPSLTGAKRALFSNNLANPAPKINSGVQLSDLTGDGSVFAWEDTRLDDSTCDFDYNDIIFRILGAKGEAPAYQTLAAPLEDITKDPAFKTIIA